MDKSQGLVGGRSRVKDALPALALGAGVVCLALGALALPAGAQSPSAVVAALESYGAGTVTFSVVPLYPAPAGAWVSIMNPQTGAVYTHAQISETLTSGTSATVSVPISLPTGFVLNDFSSFLEIPAGAGQPVVLAAETIPAPLPPIPFTPPPTPFTPTPTPTPTPTTLQIPSVPKGSTTPPSTGGSSLHKVVLPKTGAGPGLEIAGVLLLLAGGFMMVVRPRRS